MPELVSERHPTHSYQGPRITATYVEGALANKDTRIRGGVRHLSSKPSTVAARRPTPGNNMPSLAQPPKMDSTLGAAFLGHSATMLLYGVTSMQTYIYYRRSQNDGRVLKLSILVLWFLDSLHAALITAALYWYCVTHFTDPRAIQVPYWPIPTMIIVSNVSNMIVRCVFSYQLWKLNMNKHKWIIPVVIAVASVYIFGDATYFSIQLYSVESFLEVKSFSWSLYLGLSVEAGVDLLVAITQCLLLWSLQTGIQRTDMMLRILITYSINTGLLTSLVAIGALVSYSVSPRNYAYFAFYFVLSKLYVNALLATLNARSTLLEQKRTRGGMPSTVVFRVPTLPASSALGGTPAGEASCPALDASCSLSHVQL